MVGLHDAPHELHHDGLFQLGRRRVFVHELDLAGTALTLDGMLHDARKASLQHHMRHGVEMLRRALK